MIGAALLLMLQSAPPPPPPLAVPVAPAAERLGPGPHTLVISDGAQMTRIDYKTGPLCMKARDEIRRQNAPGPIIRGEGGSIYAPPASRVRAFCVPR